MRNKIILFFLAFVFLLPSSLEGLAESEETDKKFEEYRVVEQLGIMSVGEDPSQKITRGEMCETAVKLMLGSDVALTAYEPVFGDVESDHPMADYIYTALQYGIVQGYENGLFGVNEYVTNTQALAVIINILGYSPLAQGRGGYPVGYYQVASELKLNLTNPEEEITKMEFAQLIYDALDIGIMRMTLVGEETEYTVDETETLLSRRNLAKRVGQITGVGNTSLYGEVELPRDKIEIDRATFRLQENQADYQDLGKVVEYYYERNSDDGAPVILFYVEVPTKYEIRQVNSKDVSMASQTEFWCSFDGSDKKIAVSSDATVVYNTGYIGRVGEVDMDAFLTKNGRVTFIDNGAEGRADSVVIESFVTTFCSGVSTSSELIFTTDSQYGSFPFLEETNRQSPMIFKNGEPALATDLQQYDVLELLVDGNKEVIAVYASSEVVEGEAEAISETEITIGGQNYPVAADLRAYDEENYDDLILEGVKPGDSGTYYLNSAGEVVFARISKTGIQYGYVTKYAMTDRISGTLEIEIFAEKDGWKIYHFNQNVELDGINVKAEDVKEILDRSIQDRGRVVKFIANAQDEITFLDTIVHNEMESEQSMKLVQQDVTTKMDYYQGYNIDNVPYKIWNNTRVLIVPQDESDKENFLFTNNSYFVEKETYTFDLYNVSKMLIADCAVIYTSETVGGVYEDSINVVTKVVNMVNSNGENTAALYVARPVGRSGMETRKLEINASAYRSPETLYTGAVGYDEVTEIRPGDVVRCIYDQTGKVMRIKLYFRYTDPPEPNILNDPAGTDEYGYVTVLEKDPSSNFFVVQSGDNPQQNDNHKRAYLLRVILAYYPERNEVVETDINDINIGETLFFWGNLGHPALTFLVR